MESEKTDSDASVQTVVIKLEEIESILQNIKDRHGEMMNPVRFLVIGLSSVLVITVALVLIKCCC